MLGLVVSMFFIIENRKTIHKKVRMRQIKRGRGWGEFSTEFMRLPLTIADIILIIIITITIILIKGRDTLPNWMKSSKRGGGAFSSRKFLLQILDLHKGLFFGRFPKKICNIIVQKWGEGGIGVEGRLEFFWKFIQFGIASFPLSRYNFETEARPPKPTMFSESWVRKDSMGTGPEKFPRWKFSGTERFTKKITFASHITSLNRHSSGGRYHGFVIEGIFYWIESSQIKNFE